MFRFSGLLLPQILQNDVFLSCWLAAAFGTKEASISKESCVGDTTEDCAAIQKILESLEKGAERKSLKFNKGKCRALHLGRDNRGHQHRLGSDLLGFISAEKDLEVLGTAGCL